MVGLGPHQEEFVSSQHQDQFLNLERRRDWVVSVYTTHTSGSQSQSGSRVSHKENTRSMQLKIDLLRRRLCQERRRGTSSSSSPSFDNDSDNSYRPRSRTPPSESFLCDEDHLYRQRRESSPYKGLGNDAMGRALNQISKSPFTCRIEEENFFDGLLS